MALSQPPRSNRARDAVPSTDRISSIGWPFLASSRGDADLAVLEFEVGRDRMTDAAHVEQGEIQPGGTVSKIRSTWRRPMAVVTVAMAALLVATACDPPRSQTHSNGYRTSIITRDGGDSYSYTRKATTGVDVSAPRKNKGGNLRAAIVEANAPVSVDQESCVTWHGQLTGNVQPGVVLRAVTDDDRTRLIMVTQNIMFGARWNMNVHLIDSDRWPESWSAAGSAPFTSVAGPGSTTPLPWRFCARAQGNVVSFKAWSTALPEPDWNDSVNVGRVTVPNDFVHAGQPGIYAGHLRAGQTSKYRNHTTAVLEVGPDDPRWAAFVDWAAMLKSRVEAPDGSVPVSPEDPEILALAERASRGDVRGAVADAALTPAARGVTGRHVFTRMLGHEGGEAIAITAADRAGDLAIGEEFGEGLVDDGDFVARLYERVLGRSPTANQRQMWAGRVQTSSRRQVAIDIWLSKSHTGRMATELFSQLHGRAPSAAEQARAAQLVVESGADASWAMGLLIADLAP